MLPVRLPLPVIEVISDMSTVVKTASSFMLAFVPVMVMIMSEHGTRRKRCVILRNDDRRRRGSGTTKLKGNSSFS